MERKMSSVNSIKNKTTASATTIRSTVSMLSSVNNNSSSNGTTTKAVVLAKPLDKTLYCALSTPSNHHLIVKPVSLNCLDYACKDCLNKVGYASFVCFNCGQRFRKTDLANLDESPIGKQFIKDNIDKLFAATLSEFEAVKDEFVGNIDIENRIHNQIEKVKGEIRNRVDYLVTQLDQLANSFETELEESRRKLRNTNKINVPKYQQFHEKAIVRYEQLKHDVEKKENQTEEGFAAYQTTLQRMKETIEELKWINPQISLKPSLGKFEKDIIGKLVTYVHKDASKNREINERIKDGNFKLVDISVQPWDICILPNGLLLIADLNLTCLYLYDTNFKLIKSVEQITDTEFYPMGITTNNHDAIYVINHCNEKIYKTDLEFNMIAECGSQGVEASQFTHPRGICYYDNAVYVCDCGSHRIEKFDSNLIYQASFPLEFSPSRIKIANNIACIVGGLNNNSIYFYEIKQFRLKYKYERKKACGIIGVINSHFYEYNDKKIYYYDENGELIDEFKVGNYGTLLNEYNYDSGITYFDGKLILYNYKHKKLVVV